MHLKGRGLPTSGFTICSIQWCLIIMNGGDPLTLKEILGHITMKIVNRYTHLPSAQKLKQVNNLQNKFSICRLYAISEKKVENA